MSTWRVLVIGAVALLLLPGCDTVRSIFDPGPKAGVTALVVAPAAVSLKVGATVQLTAGATFDDGTESAVAPEWSVAAGAGVTVNQAGVVTAVSAGFVADVWATYREARASSRVTVVSPDDEGTPEEELPRVVVTPREQTLHVGESVQLVAELYLEDGSVTSISPKWQVAGGSPLGVSEDGVVTALTGGSAGYVWASHDGMSGASRVFTLPEGFDEELDEVVVSPSELFLREGESGQLRAEARFVDGSVLPISPLWWVSSGSSVVVSGDGVVNITALSGTGIVMAYFMGKASTSRVWTAPACGPVPSSGEMLIDLSAVQLIQVVDLQSGAVPVTTGKDLLLRAFVTHSLGGSLVPFPLSVTVTGTAAGQQLGAITSEVGCGEVKNDPGSLMGTFNVHVPAAWLGPDLELVVAVDVPTGPTLASASRLRYPSTGSLGLVAFSPPPFDITFVPVNVGGGHTVFGDDGAGRALAWVRAIWPLEEVNYTIREPYAYSGAVDDDAPSRILSELTDLWTLEGGTGYYHGVLPLEPDVGTMSGLGWLGWPIAWSQLYEPGRVWPEVMAHELGHNFGLPHAPCGAVGEYDAAFPYDGGTVGVYGFGPDQFRSGSGELYPPSTFDLMSYCYPKWVSDYNYLKVMEFREDEAAALGVAAGATGTSVLVSGWVNPGGEVILKPLFEAPARRTGPEPGEWRFQLLAASGEVLRDVPFAPATVGDAEGVRLFSFTVSVTDDLLASAAAIRLLDGAGTVRAERREDGLTPLDLGDVAAKRLQDGRTSLSWEAAAFPAVIVRDPVSGTVITRGEGGLLLFDHWGDRLEVVVSGGIRSRTLLVDID